jgi:PKD repeat protein
MLQPSRGHPRWLVVLLLSLLALLSACNLGQQPAPEEPIVTDTPASVTALPTRTLQGIATSRPSPTPIPFSTADSQQQPPTSVAVVPPTVAAAPPTSTSLPISVVIVSPIPGNVVSGNVQIVGSATHPDFLQYRLEFGPDPNPGNLWYPITGSVQSPVIASNIGVWNTTTTPDGIYQIRLRVFLRDGTELTTRVQSIRVRNQQPTPVPTATPNIPRPIASFTTDVSQGAAPLVVSFRNQSQGQVTSYSWDFGDGGSSTQASPTYVYQTPGTYEATLRVTGPGGTSNVSKQITVSSPSAPIAAFTPSQTSGNAPLSVTFNNQSQGQVTSYAWDFGDGGSSNQTSPTHTFTAEGTYNVILQATGPGGTDTAVQQITVSDPQVAAPQASFQASQTNVDIPQIVTFTNTSSGQVNQYLWDFNGDGTTDRVTEDRATSPVFEYITPGTYTVSLTATGEGGQDTTTVEITARRPPNAPNAAFSVSPERGFVPLQVQFTNETTGNATEYRWNFGNGETSSETSPVYMYESPGNYTIELTAIGPGGTSRTINMVSVQPRPQPPQAGFAASPARGTAPLRVEFSNQSEGSQLTYAWDFQTDGTIDSQEPNPTHTYTQSGNYRVTLRITDPSGQSDSATQEIQVSQEVADVPTDTPIPVPTLTDTPTATATATPTHTPTATTESIAAPVAAFGIDPSAVTAGNPVNFINESTGQIDTYQWDLDGDGQIDRTGAGPVTFTYDAAATYQASLTVTGPGGSDTLTQNVIVNPVPSATPTFTPVPSDTPVPSATPTFTPVPSDTPVPSLTPTFTPVPSDTPVPSLTPTFTPIPSDTPVPSATPTEVVPAPVASFSLDPPEPLAGNPINFISNSTGQIDSYQWDFNSDGQIDASSQETVMHTYPQAGTYNASLTVTGPGGSNTATQSITVNPPRVVVTPTETPAAPPQEPEPEIKRPLLVTSNLTGNNDIYAFTQDGGEPQNLTNHPGNDRQPSWSPDTSQFAFVSDRNGTSDIYVLTLANNTLTRLTAESGNNIQPAWSPDGTQIAFVSDRFGDNDIFVMNADGSEQVQRTTDVTNDRQPDWSPDGAQIAFVSDSAGNDDIYTMTAADGSNQTALTTNTGADTDPAWSPDGTQIAYTSVRGDVPPEEANTDIYLMNADGSESAPLPGTPATESYPVWSPDGNVLLFLSNRNQTFDVFRIVLDGLEQQALITTSEGEESSIDW